MITLVTGGSGSGKSEYAEQLVTTSGASRRLYLATMEVYGAEGRKKVERHRALRRGKGFTTVECPRNIEQVQTGSDPKETAVLLECISNLAANELFGPGESSDPALLRSRGAEQRILAGIRHLAGCAGQVVVVTNQVGEDGLDYDPETMEYIRLVGRINCRLAAWADRVVEVVFGIPVVLKECGEHASGHGEEWAAEHTADHAGKVRESR